MEHRIRSALEIALEKAEKLGRLTEEEASEMKWVPEGERLAALYLRGEGDLARALNSLGQEAVPHVTRGMVNILLANLDLPKNEAAAATVRRVLQAFQALCKDQKALRVVTGRVTYVVDQYTTYGLKQLEKSYQALREQFTAQVQQQLQQQGVSGPVRVDIGAMPEFQAQWRATVSSIEKPYRQHIEECRAQLRELALGKPEAP